jgi:hypothetical protein
MIELACSCGKTTRFRDGVPPSSRNCVFCGTLHREPEPPATAPAAAVEPPTRRPAELILVQVFVVIYLFLSAITWSSVIDSTGDLRTVAPAVATDLFWLALFGLLHLRRPWSLKLAAGAFALLLGAGVLLAARFAFFSRNGFFRPEDASINGMTCGFVILIMTTASFGIPLWLLRTQFSTGR